MGSRLSSESSILRWNDRLLNTLNGKHKYKLQWIILICRKLNYSDFNHCDQTSSQSDKMVGYMLKWYFNNYWLSITINSIMSLIHNFIAQTVVTFRVSLSYIQSIFQFEPLVIRNTVSTIKYIIKELQL